MAIGGVLFALLVLRPAVRARPALASPLGRSLAASAAGAAVLGGAQLLALAVQLGALVGGGGWPVRELVASTYVRAAAARVLACVGLVVGCLRVRRAAGTGLGWVALTAVAVLVVAGLALTLSYVGGVHALLGTSYGMMVLTKVGILAGLLTLGGMNFLAVRQLPAASDVGPARLRRFVEVEVGLGVTALFVAASLTSLPPAVDVAADRATLAEVGTRFTPRWPTLSSPAITEMPVDDRDAPRTAADRAWSEFNHNVAGL